MMTAIECPTSKDLRALTLGQLSSEDSDVLFQHISGCEVCSSELETVEDTGDSLIVSLRNVDQDAEFSEEPDCQVALAKALGSLAAAGQSAGHSETTGELQQLQSSIGEYEIVRPIGRGGMGSVYLARHTKLGREVALKVLASHRLADARIRERFEAEMLAVGRLSHPNIVTAHDAREVNGTAVLVTEFVSGMDLGQLLLRTGSLAIPDACEVVRQIAVALSYTQQQGFVHRDIKPSNVMLSASGEVKLLDLGLARLQIGENRGVEVTGAEITGTGQAMGTADYVAPEQVTDSKTVDIRADIYALGCTLFKLLTGRAPFADEQHTTAFAKMTAHVSKAPPSLTDLLPAAPRGLASLVDAMLAKDPGDRPQTPMQVVEALLPFCKGHDLTELSQAAAKLEPQPAVIAPSTSAAKPATQSWMRRKVSVTSAIAAGFVGVLLGMCLSIIVVITNPDGTKSILELAEGSKVEIKEAGSADAMPEQTGQAAVPKQTAEKDWATPLSFGILVNPESSGRHPIIDDVALVAATRLLHASDGKLPVPTEYGTWMQVSDDQSAPIRVQNAGKSFALVSNVMTITWPEIQGHVLSTQAVDKKGGTDLSAKLDKELGNKLTQLTRHNLRNQLAVIVNGQIRVAPTINSEIGEEVMISGAFERVEVKQLQQWLKGVLVYPSPQSSSESMAKLLNGVWRVLKVADGGRAQPANESGQQAAAVFHNGNLAIYRNGQLEDVGFFTLRFPKPTPAKRIAPQIQIKSSLTDREMAGIFAISPPNQMLICINESGSEFPTQFASLENSPNDLLMKLQREEPPVDQEEPTEWQNTTVAKAFETLDTWQRGELIPQQENAENARKLEQTKNKLKQIGLAFHNFHAAYGKFPGTLNVREGGVSPAKGKKIYPFSWRVAILPFIEQNDLFQEYRFDEPWDSEENRKLLAKIPEVYRSPLAGDGQGLGRTNMLGFAGEQTALGTAGGHSLKDFTDGASSTLLLVESKATVPWTKPEDISGDENFGNFLRDHSLVVLMANGFVQQMQEIDRDMLSKLITRDGDD